MRLILSILFFFIFSCVRSQSESISKTKYFDITLAGVKIGELKATRTVKDTTTIYLLDSNVHFWLILSVALHHHIETVYRGKNLFSSISVSESSNGTFTSSVIWKGGHYQTSVNSYKYKNSDSIYEPVECSIARFYFDEPVNIRKTLADAYGILAAVKKVKPGNYEVEGQGNINKYFYENGEFVRASIFSKVRYEVVARK
ncbi:MAG: hypothetical protein OEV74_16380 [Cyclobacteriaceae bacterium]|jgi:hypothetical protein|nr:hypothetical protein [Cyclobacteriaceae bacterium]MDH4297858.1 hypothetical protein [Cyclobacteriaceae bacterium]MDH5248015.1 hypothetical protein [Cyclobacteriaceae bacterium]